MVDLNFEYNVLLPKVKKEHFNTSTASFFSPQMPSIPTHRKSDKIPQILYWEELKRWEDRNIISFPIFWEETKFLGSLLNSKKEMILDLRLSFSSSQVWISSAFPLSADYCKYIFLSLHSEIQASCALIFL